MDELTVLGYFYTLQIRNEKKEKSSSSMLFLLYVHWESGAGFSSVASLFSRPGFISRMSYLTFLNLNWVYWCCWFLLGLGCPSPDPERAP